MTETGDRKLRVGVVQYLNAMPLVGALYDEDLARGLDFFRDTPSHVSMKIETGALDVAITPILTYFRIPGLKIVPGLCISSSGPILSVRVYCRKPIAQVKSVALDDSSRSSAALSRILLRKRFGISPEFRSYPPESLPEVATEDAVLLIGDPAMVDHGRFHQVLDMGREWDEMTGLPFVYAVWTLRSMPDESRVVRLLHEARERGRSRYEEFAVLAEEHEAIPRELALDYMTNRVHYELGERELSGLHLFYEYAVEQGLAPHGVPLRFCEFPE